ncbi:MAG TPA: hypothetical protein VJK54_11885 [Chthoniobacterales bacterium]|nr:hypothetical protein [Chthoniobacterales bacterium]
MNNLSHGEFLKWANEELGVYWDFLSAVFSLGGWRHGFGAFWSAHPYLALGIFLAIPIMGIIFSEGVGLISKISYILALISFIAGITRIKNEPSEAGMLVLVSLLFASAGAIVQFFFSKAGVPIDFAR